MSADIEALAEKIEAIANTWKSTTGGIYTTHAMSRDIAKTLLSDAAVGAQVGAEKRLRDAIQAYLDGDYPNPRQHRPGKCDHGRFYWDTCEACDSAYFQSVLAVEAAVGAGEYKPQERDTYWRRVLRIARELRREPGVSLLLAVSTALILAEA